MERIQVVDLQRNKLEVKDRVAVHRDGDWHETFQCWFVEVIDGEPYIYLQLRSRNKKDFPGMFDITAAGHLLAGESVEDGVREIEEELGVDVNYSELQFLGAIPNSIHLGSFKDNEISLVYLYIVDKPMNYRFQDGEVEGLVKVKLNTFHALCTGNIQTAVIEEIKRICDNVLPLVAISIDQIVPHEKAYFLKVLEEINIKLKIEASFNESLV